jgi:hypothetical protein
MTPGMHMSAIKASYAGKPDAEVVLYDLERAFALGHEFGLHRAAAEVDRCNEEGPYNAIGAAKRIRALEVRAVHSVAVLGDDFL